MRKNFFAILLAINISCFATTPHEDNQLVPYRKYVPENVHMVELYITNGAISHSLQAQFADINLYPFPVSARPHLYRVTVSATPEHYFFFLPSLHTFPIELVMTKRALNEMMEMCEFVVGENAGSLGKMLDRETFSKLGLLLDDNTRQQFLDSEKTEIEDTMKAFEKSFHEKILSVQKEWLTSWYTALPENLRRKLEANKNFLVDPALIKEFHPSFVLKLLWKQLSKDSVNDLIAQQYGMDTAVEDLCKYMGKEYNELETLRERLDASSKLEYYSDSAQEFTKQPGGAIQRLKNEIDLLPATETQEESKPKRPDWTTFDSEFDNVKQERAEDARKYFLGEPVAEPSESTTIRNLNWQPKIKQIAEHNAGPWLLNVGIAHAFGKNGLIPWLEESLGWKVDRITSVY